MSRVEKPFDNLIFREFILVKDFKSFNNNSKVALVSIVVRLFVNTLIMQLLTLTLHEGWSKVRTNVESSHDECMAGIICMLEFLKERWWNKFSGTYASGVHGLRKLFQSLRFIWESWAWKANQQGWWRGFFAFHRTNNKGTRTKKSNKYNRV